METIDYCKKLAEIQAKLKAPKTLFNAFAKYKYRSCEGILEAVKPLLDGVPLIITDKMVMIGERYYVKATASYGPLYVTAFAREDDSKKGLDSAQLTGATSSYARKYALNGLFCIDDTRDSDAINVAPEETLDKVGDKVSSPPLKVVPKAPGATPETPKMVIKEEVYENFPTPPEFITPAQLKEMEIIIADKDVDTARFLSYLGVKRLPDIRQVDVKKAFAALAAKKKKDV